MKKEIFEQKNYYLMESMHDCRVDNIQWDNKYFIITYKDLDKSIFDQNGCPYYQHSKLSIKYKFQSLCRAEIINYKKKKIVFFDILKDYDKFNKLIDNFILESYKFSVDSLNNVTIHFFVNNLKNNKHIRFEFLKLMIELDPIEIVYYWE